MLGTGPQVKCSGAQKLASPEGPPDKNTEAGEGEETRRERMLGRPETGWAA